MDFAFKSLVHLYWARFSHSQTVYILYKCQAVEIEHPFYVEICLERPNACDMKDRVCQNLNFQIKSTQLIWVNRWEKIPDPFCLSGNRVHLLGAPGGGGGSPAVSVVLCLGKLANILTFTGETSR